MKYISPKKGSGSEGKKHVVGHEHWEEFSDFRHQPMEFTKTIKESILAFLSIVLWVLLAFGFILDTAKRAKAI